MGSVSVKRINLFFAADETLRAPIQDEMGGLLQTDGECGEDGSAGHRDQHQRNGAELELRTGAGMDDDSTRVELAEVAVNKQPGTDEKNGDQQFEHRLDHLLRILRTCFSGQPLLCLWSRRRSLV